MEIETGLQIHVLNQRALLIRPQFAASTSVAACNARIHALTRELRSSALRGLQDSVPGFDSLGLYFSDIDSRRAAQRQLAQWTADFTADADAASPTVHEIPVRYDGIDLPELANDLGLDPVELIRLHSAADYTVGMLGFAPGFPYLLGMDSRLNSPRLATPRAKVPAGSVAIGGSQTGIYPRTGPGGWRLIGSTETVLFDARMNPPSLLAPGDRVRFVAL